MGNHLEESHFEHRKKGSSKKKVILPKNNSCWDCFSAQNFIKSMSLDFNNFYPTNFFRGPEKKALIFA